ncbi:MAG: hypothetical protein JWQ62_2884 [Lacunisphaera sp.]|nr:hypothetical protein [Lacunisphaera sp.]
MLAIVRAVASKLAPTLSDHASRLARLGPFPLTPPVSDRLTELQRQRALLQEHLAWLEREIAREAGAPARPAAAPLPHLTQAPFPALAQRREPDPVAAQHAAEEIMARYQQPVADTTKDVKRGCYLYFALAMGLLILGVVGWYYLHTQLAAPR